MIDALEPMLLVLIQVAAFITAAIRILKRALNVPEESPWRERINEYLPLVAGVLVACSLKLSIIEVARPELVAGPLSQYAGYVATGIIASLGSGVLNDTLGLLREWKRAVRLQNGGADNA